jgi:hypothetical protein
MQRLRNRGLRVVEDLHEPHAFHTGHVCAGRLRRGIPAQ